LLRKHFGENKYKVAFRNKD